MPVLVLTRPPIIKGVVSVARKGRAYLEFKSKHDEVLLTFFYAGIRLGSVKLGPYSSIHLLVNAPCLDFMFDYTFTIGHFTSESLGILVRRTNRPTPPTPLPISPVAAPFCMHNFNVLNFGACKKAIVKLGTNSTTAATFVAQYQHNVLAVLNGSIEHAFPCHITTCNDDCIQAMFDFPGPGLFQFFVEAQATRFPLTYIGLPIQE